MITAGVGAVKLGGGVAVIFSGDTLDIIPVTAGIDPSRIRWNKDGKDMALIPAGSFEMGDHFGEGSTNERAVHRVQLDGFYMDVHEVTVGQFREFVNQSGYKYEGDWDSVAKY
jgi:formylglycine-generating enzyme required for sulfatase activity